MPGTNNRHPDCDELLLLVPAYAIGATDPDETALIEAEIARCPEAQAELDSFRALADDLRAGVPQIEPSAALKSRLIAATQPAPPITLPASTAQPTPLPRLIPRRRPLWVTLAAALFFLLIGTNAFWIIRTNQLEQQAEANPSLNLAQDISWTRLENDTGGNAWALMMWNPTGEYGVLCAYNFPELPPNRVYQLWLRGESGRVSGGTFQVNERGFGLLSVRAGQSIDGFEVAGITTEPYGSTEPTGESVVRGEV